MSIPQSFDNTIKKAQKYQSDLLNTFPERENAILQLVEALAANQHAKSIVELSESPVFQRTYSNISKAITALSALEADSSSAEEAISKEKFLGKAVLEFNKRKQK